MTSVIRFLWLSMTPLLAPVVPEVKSSSAISSASICASMNRLSPAWTSSKPLSTKRFHDRTPSLSSSASMLTMSCRSTLPRSLILRNICSCFFPLKKMALTSAAAMSSSIWDSLSSLSSGTTTPVPQMTDRYEIAHWLQFSPVTLMRWSLKPRSISAVPSALTMSSASL